MSRGQHFRPASVYPVLSVMLLLLILVMGCPPKPVGVEPGPAPGKTDAVRALEQAQEFFNAAGGLEQPAIGVSVASRQKLQQVVDLVEKEVLGRVKKDLEMNAYALLAFSQWRLGNYGQAMEAGNRGRQLYETQNLATNRREYGMCLIVGGLCLASQTYQEFENLPGPPTQQQRLNLTGRLRQAMQDLDGVNTWLDRGEDIVVYANQWQLAVVDAAVRIWTAEGLAREVWQPEVCRWLERAGPVFAKFPASPYSRENITLTYKNKFDRRQKEYCRGR